MPIARDLCALVATVSLACLSVWVWWAMTYMIVSGEFPR